MTVSKTSIAVEPLLPENQWIADAFNGVEADIPKLYTEVRDILQDGKVTILESIEFGIQLPNPIKHVSAAVKAIRALKFLPKPQRNAVLLAVAGDGGDIELGQNKAEAIISYIEQLALAIDKQVRAFEKLAKVLKVKGN